MGLWERIAMAFTSFEPFLYARNDLRFVVIDEVSAKKSGKYYIYELYSKKLGQNLPTKNERNLGENSQNLPQNEQISQKNSPLARIFTKVSYETLLNF